VFLGFLVTFHMAAVCVLHPLNIENTMTFIVVRTIHNVLAMRLDRLLFVILESGTCSYES